MLFNKSNLIIAGLIAVTLMGISVSAESIDDDPNDVWKQEISTSGSLWSQTSSRDNIDVTGVSYEISGSEVNATLTVKGQIQSSASYTYQINLESSSGKYSAFYTYGSGSWTGQDGYTGEYGSLTNPVSDDTFTAIFEIDHPEDDFDIYGFASESVGAMEAYYDYAPDSYAPYFGESTEDETDDTTDWEDYFNNMSDIPQTGNSTTTNPSTENPTDTTIQVSIDSVKYDFSSSKNKNTFDIIISGTTNGVDHCKICFVNYYNDGTTDKQYVWMPSFDLTSYFNAFASMMGDTNFEAYHFKSLSDNWQTWEYKIKGTVDTSGSETSNLNPGDINYNKTLSKTVVYVRGFKDADETQWNQDSYSIDNPYGSTSSDDDSGSGVPGFETIFLLAALGIALIFLRKRK